MPSDEMTELSEIGPVPVAKPGGPGPVTRRAARNAAVLSVAEVVGKVATLAFTVIAARELSTSDFGAFAYALSFGLLLATLPSWGFEALLIQRGSANLALLPHHLGETLIWRSIIAVPLFLVAGTLGYLSRPSTSSGIALVCILAASIVDEYTHAWRAAAGVKQNLVGVSMALVVQRVATAGLVVGALFAGTGLVGLSLAYLAGTLVGMVTVTVIVRRLGVRADFRSVSGEDLRRTGRLSIPIGFSVVISMALFRIDQVILEAFQGEAAVGAYAAAYRLFETILFVAWAVRRAIFPVMSTDTATWRLHRGVEKGLAALGFLYVPFGVGLFLDAEPVLGTLFGAPYASTSAEIVRWLAASPILFGIAFLASAALMARDRRWQILAANAAAVVFNVGINVVLIPALGATGAAIATTASYGLLAGLLLAFLAPEIGFVRIDRALAVPVAASAVMAAVLIAIDARLLVDVPVGAAVYLLSWYVAARTWAPDHIEVLKAVVPWRRG